MRKFCSFDETRWFIPFFTRTCLPLFTQDVHEHGSYHRISQWMQTFCVLACLLIPLSRVLLEKLTVSQLVEKFTTLYGTRRFITTFTNACPLSLSWARWIRSMSPHPTSWRSILIVCSHLSLSLQSGLYLSGFPTKTLYTSFLSPICATFPAHLILLDLITWTIFGEESVC